MDDSEFFDMVVRVRNAIQSGINPRMISVGTSGSYIVYEQSETGPRIAGVFKPMDEEPYGNLKYVYACLSSPKRVFLRKYLWWAMGRPWYVKGGSFQFNSQLFLFIGSGSFVFG